MSSSQSKIKKKYLFIDQSAFSNFALHVIKHKTLFVIVNIVIIIIKYYKCLSMSLITISSCLKLRVVLPNVLFTSLIICSYIRPHHGDLERLNCHVMSSLTRWSCSLSLFCIFFIQFAVTLNTEALSEMMRQGLGPSGNERVYFFIETLQPSVILSLPAAPLLRWNK